MVLGEEEGLVCEVLWHWTGLEHESLFKYLRCVLDESGADGPECRRKVASWGVGGETYGCHQISGEC